MTSEPQGWSWFAPTAPEEDENPVEICRVFARCFKGSDGERALEHLSRLFLERRLPPEASDAALRHLEGQRWVVAHLRALIARGQQ